MGEVVLSFDVDWAPDGVLEPIVERLRASGVPATFFATHYSPLLASLERDQFEIALHPRIDDLRDGVTSVEELLALYPDAVGVRSHSLVSSGPLLQRQSERGIRYESNCFLPLHGLAPVWRLPDLVTIPYFWADDYHFLFGRRFALEELDLAGPGLKVLDFHPIHVFMNTSAEDQYGRFREHYRDVERLKPLVNRDDPGSGTLFDEVVDWIAASGTASTLADVWRRFARA